MNHRYCAIMVGLLFVGGLFSWPIAAGAEDSAADTKPAKDKAAAKHPFQPSIDRAKEAMVRVEKIKGYSAVVVKRERVNGKLLDHEYMYVKIRHKPFSVYIRFLAPEKMKDREVIYVEGKNDGKLIAHEPPGTIKGLIRAKLEPTSALAMVNNRYPITEIGILNILKRLVEIGETDTKYGEATAKTYENAKVDGRPCEVLEFTHPERRDYFKFHLARVFVDNEYDFPIRYASYEWPETAGGEPVLMEEYSYTKLKINEAGWTDADFDPDNPKYIFP